MPPRHRRRRPKESGQRGPYFVIAAAAVLVAAAGALVAAPTTAQVAQTTSLAPTGPVGYVVCPTAVTPLELATHTAEAPIPLPVGGTPVLGTFAIATSPDGRWAFVATTVGVAASPPAAAPGHGAAIRARTSIGGVHDVLIPVDLAAQRALPPIPLPGQAGSHAVVVLPDGRTALVAIGSTIVPVDTATRTVGAPVDLGAGHVAFGMALDPAGTTLYVLVPDAVIPVRVAHDTPEPAILTGLAVSSVYSPHGIAVSADGTTIYVAGQGGVDFGGRVMPIDTANGAPLPEAGFDRFGIADPAALTVVGGTVLVVDAANNWVNPVPLASFSDPPPPVHLPTHAGRAAIAGTQHPTDVVSGPGTTGAFIVDGFGAVVPYQPSTEAFGRPIPVCSGATSMAVAPAP